MNKYVVDVHINNFDKEGINYSEHYEFNFPINGLEALFARKKAVEKLSELIDFYGDGENGFSSFEEAGEKGFKDYKSFSASLILSTDDEPHTVIIGNGAEEDLEALEYESEVYKRNFYIAKTTIFDSKDAEYVVIEEDIYFLMSIY